MKTTTLAAVLSCNALIASVASADFTVDAAVNWSASLDDTSTGAGYFFTVAQYLEYDLGGFTGKSWRETAPDWRLPESWEGKVDAALNWQDGVAILFKDGEYVRYALEASEPAGPPRPSSKDWRLPRSWRGRVVAAANWGDGFAYLFRGTQYIRYKIGRMKPLGRPRNGERDFQLPTDWNGRVDAAVSWGNGTVYLCGGASVVEFATKGKAPVPEPKDTYAIFVDSSSSVEAKASTAPAQPASPAPVPASLRDAMLAEHNRVRASINVGPLEWSDVLAAHAQDWATTLSSRGCQLEHRQGGKYGENLAMWTGQQPVSFAVKMWESERQLYDGGPFNERNFEAGHCTQFVWRNSSRVGCATATCGDTTVAVCNYDPPGNFLG